MHCAHLTIVMLYIHVMYQFIRCLPFHIHWVVRKSFVAEPHYATGLYTGSHLFHGAQLAQPLRLPMCQCGEDCTPLLLHCIINTTSLSVLFHDDVIKWKLFLAFLRGIHRSPVNSPHKGQWRRALMFCLICAWIKGWVNNREACDLRRHRAHYDVIVMSLAGVN